MPPLPRAYHDSTSCRPEPLARGHGLSQSCTRTWVWLKYRAGEVGPGGEEDDAEQQVAGAPGGHPQHGDEQGEQQGREADVVLEAHHADGEQPGQDDGANGRGSMTSRLPKRAVGMVSSSRFSAK